jgi:hypothetical protein
MYEQYKKNAAVMSAILALVAMTGMMFVKQTVYSATRGSIESLTVESKSQNLDLSGIPIRTANIVYKTIGSPFSIQYRSVYIAVTEDEKTEPKEWAEIQDCRVWGKVDFWPESRCTVTYPKVSKTSTFWIRVTTNNPDGSSRCGYGVTPFPNGEYCGDAETRSLQVNP